MVYTKSNHSDLDGHVGILIILVFIFVVIVIGDFFCLL